MLTGKKTGANKAGNNRGAPSNGDINLLTGNVWALCNPAANEQWSDDAKKLWGELSAALSAASTYYTVAALLNDKPKYEPFMKAVLKQAPDVYRACFVIHSLEPVAVDDPEKNTGVVRNYPPPGEELVYDC